MPLATLQDVVRGIKDRGAAQALVAFGAAAPERWSYADLATTVDYLAAGMSRRGLRSGEPVAIYAPNSPRWLALCLAAVSAGAVVMPVDERSDEREIAELLAANGCRWIATTTRHAERLAGEVRDSVSIIVMDRDTTSDPSWIGWMDLPTNGAVTITTSAAGDVAAILHTSGTTGTPKAVPLSHANLISNVTALMHEHLVGEGDRVLMPLPLHHVYPLTVGALTPLAAGATLVFPAGLSGPELAAALRDGDATHLVGVPRLYDALLAEIRSRAASAGPRSRRLFSALLALSTQLGRRLHIRVGRVLFRAVHGRLAPRLRLLVSGGAALDVDTEEQLESLGWEVLSGYGLTETSPILAFNRRGAKRRGTVGHALPGVDVRIATPGADGLGEIQARGASVFAGYRNDPAATAAAFTADGWFRTGDLGFIDSDGYLHVTARVTETIVLPSGKKIFPEAVESVYAESPLIREMAVLFHQGSLVALIVPDTDAIRSRGAVRAEELIREDLTERGGRLPPHERLAGFAVVHEPLPRTHLGKPRRHLLGPLYERARERRGAPTPAEPSNEDRALLETPAAERLWTWLKERFPDQPLSLDTSPQIDLGLDSLGWMNLTLEIERALGLALTEASIARIVTVRDLLKEAVAVSGRLPTAPAVVPPTPEFTDIEAPTAWHGLYHWLLAMVVGLVMRSLFRLRVAGVENVPRDGPCLICPNHVSYLDSFAVAAALPYGRLRETWWAGWTGILFTGRLSRAFSRVAQVIPIDPDRAVASSLAWGSGVLDRGRCLVWFPEGARSYDGTPQRFLPGVGVLVAGHLVPVVPVAITGTFAAWPRQRRFPRLRPVTVTFGKPIEPQALVTAGRMGDPAAIAAVIQARVADLLRESPAPHGD